MKSISWVTRFIIIIVFSLTWGIGAFATKTVIFYSSIGMGHLSASRAIKEKIESADLKLRSSSKIFVISCRRSIES